MAKAFRTTSYEALCILTGTIPIEIELEKIARTFIITRGYAQHPNLEIRKSYRQWDHPADTMKIQQKLANQNYTINIFTDGSKTEKGVGSGVAIMESNKPISNLQYRLSDKCSNNQAEQFAILKALMRLTDIDHLPNNKKLAAIHTDSRITLDALANPNNHQHLIETIRQTVRNLESNNWTIHFTWVKAHIGIFGNEEADRLAKEAANNQELQESYNLFPRSAVLGEVFEDSVREWQRRWDTTEKGAVTKSFFPNVKQRLSVKLNLSGKLTTLLTGHGKLREYFHRFKITDNPNCVCNKEVQTVDHLLWRCEQLKTQRQILERDITKVGGKWPISNNELIVKHKTLFVKFINSIDLDSF